MKSNAYVLNSPKYPRIKDFEKFPVWCEWHDAGEVPYLEALCTSKSEYQEKIIFPYTNGEETYYPILETSLPFRTYLFIKVDIEINDNALMNGYVTTVEDEVVSICIWLDSNAREEIFLLSNSRMMAKEDNPTALKELTKFLGSNTEPRIKFDSKIYLSNGAQVSGYFEV